MYKRLQADDQDSVRLLTVEDLIAIARGLLPAEVKDQLLKNIRQTVGDKSWRVRYMAALHFNEVSVRNLRVFGFVLSVLPSLRRPLASSSSARS